MLPSLSRYQHVFGQSWPRFRLSSNVVRSMSSRQHQDCYKILGVKFDAEHKEIKENFYKLSKEFHPDVNKDESSLKKFREIVEAYEILSNSEKRREYDSKMGFGRSSSGSSSGTSTQYHYEDSSGTRTRYHGMKGEFRNGTFVDDEYQEYRHIQYDLDPEKMEKIWKRYKARWERLDEIDRVKKLEEKKIVFRKRMEMKRERMLQNLMSKEEKEEFMYKIRMHRPDACEDFQPGDISEETKSTSGKSEESSNENMGKDKDSGTRNDPYKDRKYSDEDFDRDTRNILKEKFGMSDEDLDRLDFGGTPFDKKKKGTKKTRGSEPGMDFQRDQFFAGMKNTSEDATSWKDFVKKAHKSSTDRWEQLKNNRVDSVQTSKRYNIEKESNFGAKLVLFLVLSAIFMGYSEYRYQN